MSSDLPNIAFIGGAGAGKSTLAQYMFDRYPYNKASFAEPLKDVAVRIWGPTARTDRSKLQPLGVAVRDIDSDAWANLVRGRLYNDLHAHWVVDDCRFPNEYEMLREFGFTFIRVTAPNSVRIDRLKSIGKLQDESQLSHESELYQTQFEVDYYLDNDQGHRSETYEALEDILDREARKL